MRILLLRWAAPATLLVCAALGTFTTTPSAGETFQTRGTDQTVTVRLGDRELLRYQHAPRPFKPYVHSWYTPEGRQVLRDAPADHLHHHGLMFAVGADGVNFWEEPAQAGKQVPVGGPRITSRSENDRLTATISQELQWQNAEGDPLMLESRKVTLRPNSLPNASLLEWETRLEPAEGQSPLELWGRNYFGLGLRMVASMDQEGEFRNAEGDPGEAATGSQRIQRGVWCAYTAHIDDHPVTIAMFDHPDNPRPVSWFTMTAPFAYLSATLGLDQERLSLTEGQVLQLRYAVIAWDGRPSEEEIAAAYQAWLP